MLRTYAVIGFVTLAPLAYAASPVPAGAQQMASMTADQAYVKAMQLMQRQFAELKAENAELRAVQNEAARKLKDLETQAKANNAAAKSTLISFAVGDTAKGVDQLTAQAKARAESSATQAKLAAADYKAAGALAFATDTNRAVAAYEAALKLAPDDSDVINKLMWIYGERLARYNDQLRIADIEIASANPVLKANGYNDRGNALWRQGDLDGGEKAYKSALQIARTNNLKQTEENSLVNLSNIAFARKDYPTSIDFSKQALALNDQNRSELNRSIILTNLGASYYSMNSLAEAEDYYRQALALNIKMGNTELQGDSLNNLGGIMWKRNDVAGACVNFRKALAIYEDLNAGASEVAKTTRNNIRDFCPKQ